MDLRRWLRFRILKVVRMQGSVDQIARGIALGVGMDFLPTFGFGLVFAYVSAIIFRANRIAAMFTSLAVKPLILPFYGANILVGRLLMGQPTENVKMPDASFLSIETFKHVSNVFLLGSAVNTVISMIVVYFLSSYLIKVHRARRKRRREVEIQ